MHVQAFSSTSITITRLSKGSMTLKYLGSISLLSPFPAASYSSTNISLTSNKMICEKDTVLYVVILFPNLEGVMFRNLYANILRRRAVYTENSVFISLRAHSQLCLLRRSLTKKTMKWAFLKKSQSTIS